MDNTLNKKDLAFECIEEKIYGYPNFEGKGIKIFPEKQKSRQMTTRLHNVSPRKI